MVDGVDDVDNAPGEGGGLRVLIRDSPELDALHAHVAHLRLSRESVLTRERAVYRGTPLIRNIPHVGPYSSPMPRDLW